MTNAHLIAQARRLADEEAIHRPPGAPETTMAWTLRELANELERMELKYFRLKEQ